MLCRVRVGVVFGASVRLNNDSNRVLEEVS